MNGNVRNANVMLLHLLYVLIQSTAEYTQPSFRMQYHNSRQSTSTQPSIMLEPSRKALFIRLQDKQMKKNRNLHKTHRWNLWHDMYAHDGI